MKYHSFFHNHTGAVMLVTLLFLLLLTILGTSSLYLAYTEAVLSRTVEIDAKAFYWAESGVEQALYWFSNPDRFTGTPEDSFNKKMINNTSFFDENGISQYRGTSINPDILYPAEDRTLKIYAPATPGALCTVESTGISGRIRRKVTAELFEDISRVSILRGSWRVD